MLLSLVVGNSKSGVTNDWELTTDSYGNTFIFNESIRQRIRLGKNVDTMLVKVFSANWASRYEFASHTFLSNNNKNMNLSLMNFWSKDKEVRDNHKDDHVAYITFLNKDYKIISYDTLGHSVVQTYHKSGEYQGLALLFKEVDTTLLSVMVKDLKNNKYASIIVYVNEEGIINFGTSLSLSTEEFTKAKSDLKKLGKKTKRFLMDIDGFPTNTFIVNPKYKDKMESLVGNISNANIIVLEDDMFNEDNKESLDKLLQESIVDARIRAITAVGVKIPYSFFKTYNILYLFNYDIDNNKIECVRSK